MHTVKHALGEWTKGEILRVAHKSCDGCDVDWKAVESLARAELVDACLYDTGEARGFRRGDRLSYMPTTKTYAFSRGKFRKAFDRGYDDHGRKSGVEPVSMPNGYWKRPVILAHAKGMCEAMGVPWDESYDRVPGIDLFMLFLDDEGRERPVLTMNGDRVRHIVEHHATMHDAMSGALDEALDEMRKHG